MREVEEAEAKDTFLLLLDVVEQGGQVAITRGGKRVARLVPDLTDHDREKARAAAERIIARRRGVTLGGIKIEDLINEGRR